MDFLGLGIHEFLLLLFEGRLVVFHRFLVLLVELDFGILTLCFNSVCELLHED
jgi:hypothetical protein